MKINTLNYFLVLSASKSINEAAKKLFISQPSLTKSIQLMENELGTVLFTRTKAGIQLTCAGKAILPDAQKIVAMYNNWLSLAKDTSAPPIKIYGHISFSDFLLPQVILQLKRNCPDRNISYRSVANPEQYIVSDVTPISIVMTVCNTSMQQTLTKIQRNAPLILMTGEYQCLMDADNPFAKKGSISLEDLKQMDLMLPVPSKEFLVEESFLKSIMSTIFHTVSPSHVMEVDTLQNVIDAVRNSPDSYAVSFYPALMRYQAASNKKLVHVPFTGLKTKCSLCLFYSKKASQQYPIINTIIDHMVEAAHTFLGGIKNE